MPAFRLGDPSCPNTQPSCCRNLFLKPRRLQSLSSYVLQVTDARMRILELDGSDQIHTRAGPFANEPGLPLTWVTSKEHKDARPQEPVFLPLDPFQACLVAESAKLWSEHLHKMANLYCCRLQRAMSGDCEGLRITGEGEEAQMLKEDIYELLYIHPPKDIVSCDRTQFRSVLQAIALLYHTL